ncbi:MAG: sugar phosphate isomerase/epimerase [Alphaproteobacteria bacterium]|nr:sugar phosphate isomerase/epimerase [Alphaproteobacteria bacterium]
MRHPIGIISMQFVRPFTADDLGLFETIKELGFDFIELLMPEPEDDLKLDEVRMALSDNDLGVVLAARVSTDRSIVSADPKARQGGIDYLKTCIETAALIGAEIVGGPLYGGPLVFAGVRPTPIGEAERKARFERSVEGLVEVSADAAAADVRLALEPLNRFETDIVSTVSQAIDVVDQVGSPALGLLLDSFHMNIEERSIGDAIRQAGARIVHFQANENHRGFPGSGHLPWSEIARALHDVGYAGPVSLEPFRRNDDRFGVPLAQWRPPVADESDNLRQGLAFMRAALAMTDHRPMADHQR